MQWLKKEKIPDCPLLIKKCDTEIKKGNSTTVFNNPNNLQTKASNNYSKTRQRIKHKERKIKKINQQQYTKRSSYHHNKLPYWPNGYAG